MIQRFIGVSLGAIVTYVMLLATNINAADKGAQYGLAVIVGAIVSFAWPWVVALNPRPSCEGASRRADQQGGRQADERRVGRESPLRRGPRPVALPDA